MGEIKHLNADIITMVQAYHISKMGGIPGIREGKSVEGGIINRIENQIFYHGVSELFEIASLYGCFIARGHIFNDGNKRTSFTSMYVFLYENGYELNVSDNMVTDIMPKVGFGEVEAKELEKWLGANSIPIK
jgi:death on curing protein